MAHTHSQNPFSAKYLAPGNGEFVLPTTGLARGLSPDGYLQVLARRFRQSNSVGQIVGPHGCGKSTLAEAMLRVLRKDFKDFRRITIRKKELLRGGILPSIHEILSDESSGHARTMIIIDGIEVLSWVNRVLLIANIRIGNMGLLLTTHQRIAGISVIETLRPNPQHFLEIARSKCAARGAATAEISKSAIETTYVLSQGDYREALMKLYEHARD